MLGIQVAIIVPVYNTGGHKLSKCIQSILRQTYRQFILLFVDDSSTDDSGAVCDSFAKEELRIKVIHQINKGSTEARKTGIFSKELQKSKYICFCDSGGTIPKNALEKLVSVVER